MSTCFSSFGGGLIPKSCVDPQDLLALGSLTPPPPSVSDTRTPGTDPETNVWTITRMLLFLSSLSAKYCQGTQYWRCKYARSMLNAAGVHLYPSAPHSRHPCRIQIFFSQIFLSKCTIFFLKGWRQKTFRKFVIELCGVSKQANSNYAGITAHLYLYMHHTNSPLWSKQD